MKHPKPSSMESGEIYEFSNESQPNNLDRMKNVTLYMLAPWSLAVKTETVRQVNLKATRGKKGGSVNNRKIKGSEK